MNDLIRNPWDDYPDPGDAEMDEPGDFEDYDPEDGSIINNRISSDRSEL